MHNQMYILFPRADTISIRIQIAKYPKYDAEEKDVALCARLMVGGR